MASCQGKGQASCHVMTAWLLALAKRSAAVTPRPRTRFEQLSAVAAEVQPAVEQDTCHAEAAGGGITTAPGCCSGLPAASAIGAAVPTSGGRRRRARGCPTWPAHGR